MGLLNNSITQGWVAPGRRGFRRHSVLAAGSRIFQAARKVAARPGIPPRSSVLPCSGNGDRNGAERGAWGLARPCRSRTTQPRSIAPVATTASDRSSESSSHGVTVFPKPRSQICGRDVSQLLQAVSLTHIAGAASRILRRFPSADDTTCRNIGYAAATFSLAAGADTGADLRCPNRI